MTPKQIAARWLADVPRYNPGGCGGNVWLHEADALAAIARHLAPGDDLVERATAALEGVTEGPWMREAQGIYHSSGHGLVAHLKAHEWARDWPTLERDGNFIAFTRQWVPEAAARIAALTATVAEVQADRDKWFEGAGAHHVASMKQAQRADQAEAEAATLRDRLARMEGALRWVIENNDEGNGLYSRDGTYAKRARAALTDGGSNG